MSCTPRRIGLLLSVVLGAGLTVFLAIRAGSSAGSVRIGEEAGDLVTTDGLAKVRSPAQGEARLAEGEVDLLDLIDLSKDAIAGNWGFQDRALLTSAVRSGRLQIPCVPPEEYDLRLHVTRKKGLNSINLGFVMGGRQGMIVLDGDAGQTAWLHLASEPDLATNPTAAVGKLFEPDKPARVLISVRKRAVSVSVGEKKVLEWSGPPSDLTVASDFLVPHAEALFLATWNTTFRVDEAILVRVSGRESRLR